MVVYQFINESHTGDTSIDGRVEGVDYQVEKAKQRAPRPKNAFILYRSDKQKSLACLKNLHSKEASRIIGKMWRAESKEVIRKYERIADEEKLSHFMKYPWYKYAPKQKKKLKGTQNMALDSTETSKPEDQIQMDDTNIQVNTYDILNEIDMFNCQYKDIFEELPSNFLNNEPNTFTENETMINSSLNMIAPMINSSTLPSDLIEDIHILPDISNLEIFTLDDFKYEFSE